MQLVISSPKRFSDIYCTLFKVAQDVLEDRIEPKKAAAFASTMKVAATYLAIEMQMNQLEINTGKSLPQIGDRLIGEQEKQEVIDLEVDSSGLNGTDITVQKKPSVRLPKIGIAGLIPSQAGEITKTFGGTADFTFWDAESNLSMLKPMATCDVVFIHTNHIPHTAISKLKTHGANTVNVGGGVNAMKTAIRNFFKDK